MDELKYDPEFWQVFEPMANIPRPSFDDPVVMRKATEVFMRERLSKAPQPEGITETTHEVSSLDGTNISVTRFVPSAAKNGADPQRAAIYIHGGGMIMGSVDLFKPVILNYAHDYEIQIFAVSWRLAPEFPAPAGIEDTYATIQWLQAHAKEFGIDPARIGLLGHSAGGGVAAGTALYARDKGLNPPLARLVLVYPMLDDRTSLDPSNPLNRYLGWSDRLNKMGWKAYLGGRDWGQRDDVSIYAAPGRAESLEGLPPTYIDVGGFDLFAEECLAFATKLTRANNSVEMHLYPGLPHGFEGVAPLIRAATEAALNRKRAMSDF